MKTKKKSRMAGVLWVLLLTLLDQVTKYIAYTTLKGSPGVPVIPGVFELFYLENQGAAFGILQNRQWFFIMIALVMMAAAVYVYYCLPSRSHYNGLRLVAVLIASGAAGNMIDRMLHRYVIDFLYFSLIDFPVFNVADCYVCAGAALLVILLFTVYRKEDFSFFDPRKEESEV